MSMVRSGHWSFGVFGLLFGWNLRFEIWSFAGSASYDRQPASRLLFPRSGFGWIPAAR